MAEAAHLLAHDREACTTPSLGRVRHHATPFRRARRVGPPRCRHDDGGAFEGAIGIWRQSDRACQAAGTARPSADGARSAGSPLVAGENYAFRTQALQGDGGGAPSLDRRNVRPNVGRSEEHTSELQSLMRNSYAVFCLKKKKTT